MNARAALLWRIALREEIDNPRTSISAIDTLNKQEGVYVANEAPPNQGVIVNINQFVVGSAPTAPPPGVLPAREAPLHPVADVLEAEFTTLKIEVPDNAAS